MWLSEAIPITGHRDGYGAAASVFALQQGGQVGEGLVGRFRPLRAGGRAFAEVLLIGVARVLVIVAVQAEQFPVGAILRVVVVVVIAVVHGQFAQALAGKLPGATAADMRVHLQGFIPVAFLATALGIGEDAVELGGRRG